MNPIVVRASQLNVFSEREEDRFHEELQDFLIESGYEPQELGSPDDPMRLVDLAVQEAEEHGLTSEDSIAVYVWLVAEFGYELEELQDRRWFPYLARDENEPPEPDWIDRLVLNIDQFLQADEDKVNPPSIEPDSA